MLLLYVHGLVAFSLSALVICIWQSKKQTWDWDTLCLVAPFHDGEFTVLSLSTEKSSTVLGSGA